MIYCFKIISIAAFQHCDFGALKNVSANTQ